DGAAVRALPDLDVLAGLAMPIGGVVAGPTALTRADERGDELDGREIFDSVRPFLTYSVGMDVATPLMQISEIVPYPGELIPLENGHLRGVFVHRTTSVPLLCL